MNRFVISWAALSLLTVSTSAWAQPGDGDAAAPGDPAPGDPAPAAESAPDAPSGGDEASTAQAIEELRRELAALRAANDNFRIELTDLKRKQSEAPSVLPPPKATMPAALPISPSLSIALRYDNIFPDDPLGQFAGDPYIDGFRMRVRAGLVAADRDAAVVGGVRFALGRPRNPAIGFVSLGEGFQSGVVSLDRFWVGFRPFDDRTFFDLRLGKMPQPFWRGQRGRFRSEMVWDSDVNPAGVSLDLKLFGQDGVIVDTTAGYFVMHDIEDLRFQGLTGPVSLIANQLRVKWRYVTGAFAFYDYENLNTGLSAPNANTNGGVAPQASSPAFLLTEGFQSTNNRVSYGPGAEGFVTDAFRIINPTIEGHIPLPLDDLGEESEIFLFADYTHNLSVNADANGISGTIGMTTGDHHSGWLSPVELWFTYRLVQADAVLATFADSNLGGGSNFRGFEVGASFDATQDVTLSAGYFDYLSGRQMDASFRRFFLDVRWDY